MNTRNLVLALALFALAAFAGCATREDVEILQSQLQAEQQRSSNQIARLEKELQENREQLKTEIKQTSSPVQTRQADIWAELTAMRGQIAALAGQIDAMSMDMRAMKTSQANATAQLAEVALGLKSARYAIQHELAVDLDAIDQRFQHKPASGAAPANATLILAGMDKDEAEVLIVEQGGEAEQPEAAPKPEEQADPSRAMYDAARDSFEAREYAKAQRMWNEFAQAYPKHALKPNAIFWEGEAFYQMKDYPNAILKYQEIIDKYPKSTKYKFALYKQAFAFDKIGNTKARNLRLQDVIKKFPNTPQAKRAKQVLDK